MCKEGIIAVEETEGGAAKEAAVAEEEEEVEVDHDHGVGLYGTDAVARKRGNQSHFPNCVCWTSKARGVTEGRIAAMSVPRGHSTTISSSQMAIEYLFTGKAFFGLSAPPHWHITWRLPDHQLHVY